MFDAVYTSQESVLQTGYTEPTFRTFREPQESPGDLSMEVFKQTFLTKSGGSEAQS
jgi:hypothetical protein